MCVRVRVRPCVCVCAVPTLTQSYVHIPYMRVCLRGTDIFHIFSKWFYRHKRLRPQLVQVVRKRKVDLHKKEVKLCEHYDTLLSEWEKKVEKAEGNAKRK